MLRATLLSLVLLAAAACGGPGPQPASPTNLGGQSTPAAGLTIRADGVGPITAATPVTVAALAALFPDDVVAEELITREDGDHALIVVKRAGEALLWIEQDGGRLYGVWVTSPEIPTAGGLVVGDGYGDVVAKLGPVDCFGMVEEHGGDAICVGEHAVSAILPITIEPDGTDHYYDRPIPDQERAIALGGSRVTTLVWAPRAD